MWGIYKQHLDQWICEQVGEDYDTREDAIEAASKLPGITQEMLEALKTDGWAHSPNYTYSIERL